MVDSANNSDIVGGMNKAKLEPLDKIFHALSDGTRRSILREVARGERGVKDVAAAHSGSLASISKHIMVLENANLIQKTRRGSFQLISLKVESLQTAKAWLSFYDAYWNDRFDDLEALIAEQQAISSDAHRKDSDHDA